MSDTRIDVNEMGSRIREKRGNTSKRKLADLVGCHRDVISEYENGNVVHPSVVTIEKMAKVFGVSFYWLCYGDLDEVDTLNHLKSDIDKHCERCKSIMSISELKFLNQTIKMQAHVSSMRSLSKKLEDDLEDYYQSNLDIST